MACSWLTSMALRLLFMPRLVALGPAVNAVAQTGQRPAQGAGAGIAGAEAGQHQHRLAIAGGQLAMAQATQQVASVGQHGPAFSQ